MIGHLNAGTSWTVHLARLSFTLVNSFWKRPISCVEGVGERLRALAASVPHAWRSENQLAALPHHVGHDDRAEAQGDGDCAWQSYMPGLGEQLEEHFLGFQIALNLREAMRFVRMCRFVPQIGSHMQACFSLPKVGLY